MPPSRPVSKSLITAGVALLFMLAVLGKPPRADEQQPPQEASKMKLGYVLLYVRDVRQTLDLYEKALGLDEKFYSEEGDRVYGELDTGAATLAFVSYELAEENDLRFEATDLEKPAPAFNFTLITADVASSYDKAVRAGLRPVSEPQEKPWGQTVAYLRDPNGFLVEIATPISSS